MNERLLSYVLLAVMWIAFCAVHSLLISQPFSHWVLRRFPTGHRFHRLFFNIFSLITFIPLVWYSMHVQSDAIFRWTGCLRIVQAVMILSGAVLVIGGALVYSGSQFLGIDQIRRRTSCRSIGADCELSVKGVLGLVRHPWYTAVIVLVWARNLDVAAIVVNTIVTAYMIVGAVLEERKLVAEFGRIYRAYQATVSMFLPVKWMQFRIARRKPGR